jgi:hypothetical protein
VPEEPVFYQSQSPMHPLRCRPVNLPIWLPSRLMKIANIFLSFFGNVSAGGDLYPGYWDLGLVPTVCRNRLERGKSLPRDYFLEMVFPVTCSHYA